MVLATDQAKQPARQFGFCQPASRASAWTLLCPHQLVSGSALTQPPC